MPASARAGRAVRYLRDARSSCRSRGALRCPAFPIARTSDGTHARSPCPTRGAATASSSSSARPTGARPGESKRLVVRVDDTPHAFKLEGKQGYGKARGIWQTVYLEARGEFPIASVHFTPRADLAGVGVDVRLLEPAPRDLTVG